ncbi:secretion protein HlyD [Rhodanobacter thiooxydans]|uniref:Secretion protein HlyD n=1 Tax=Rhodanobacter thiooxydans TaxID=416169 RepID=A0A154QK15_9GAMM|nr:secretion protein HlyD [Rhodanobacter thiooxydans]KZC24538.1 secretion protein HlyD [Rhodanobacter thiooxydans]MCW0201739.1 secretion protein HlyD [Rhodanobacter thiooxydans]
MKIPSPPTGKTRWIVIAVVVIAIGGALAFWRLHDHGDQNTLRLYGNVDIREVELAFRQPGRLTHMAFDEGDAVTTGAVMAQLDATPYHEKLAAAEAELQAAQAQLDKLHSGNRPQEIAQAREQVRQAQASANEAARNFERQNTLLASGASSQRLVDAARAARDQSAANLAAAQASLSLATAGFRREDIDAGQARVAAAEAALTQARTAVADATLVAPSNGIVISRVREPGSMVANSTPVYSLSLRDPVYLRAYVDEADLGRIAPGTKVRVHTDSSATVYHGQIGFISPRAEFTPKTVETADLRTDLVYRLRVVVSDADQGLRQGMPVTIDVDTTGAAGKPARGS